MAKKKEAVEPWVPDLIELVEPRIVLYNTNHNDYYKVDIKAALWAEIAQELAVPGGQMFYLSFAVIYVVALCSYFESQPAIDKAKCVLHSCLLLQPLRCKKGGSRSETPI